MNISLKTLCEKHPDISIEDLKYIRKRFNTIKDRCGSNNKYYANVKCEFDLFGFINYLKMSKCTSKEELQKVQVCRFFDEGNYSYDNIMLISKTQNLTERFIYKKQSILGETEFFKSLNCWYKNNSEKMNLPSIHIIKRRLDKGEIIFSDDNEHAFKLKRLYTKNEH